MLILPSVRLFPVRTGDREGTKAVILKGKAGGAQQLRGRPEARCVRRRHVAELPLDLLHRVERLVDPRCQHRTPRSRQAPPDLRQRRAGYVLLHDAPARAHTFGWRANLSGGWYGKVGPDGWSVRLGNRQHVRIMTFHNSLLGVTPSDYLPRQRWHLACVTSGKNLKGSVKRHCDCGLHLTAARRLCDQAATLPNRETCRGC